MPEKLPQTFAPEENKKNDAITVCSESDRD